MKGVSEINLSFPKSRMLIGVWLVCPGWEGVSTKEQFQPTVDITVDYLSGKGKHQIHELKSDIAETVHVVNLVIRTNYFTAYTTGPIHT